MRLIRRLGVIFGLVLVGLFVLGALSAKAHAGDGEWTVGAAGCEGYSSLGGVQACAQAYYQGVRTGQGNDCPVAMEVSNAFRPHPSVPDRYLINWSVKQETKSFNSETMEYFCQNLAQFTTDAGSITIVGDECEYPAVWDTETGECVTPFDCSTLSGNTFTLFYAGSGTLGQACNDPGEGDACSAQATNTPICSGGECVASMAYTGASCETPDIPSGAVETAGEPPVNCINQGGVGICFAASDPGCGWVNGDPVCLGDVPNSGCAFGQGGGMICEDGAGIPPAPTQGDGTTPATPDGAFTADTGDGDQDYNYFGPGTVAGSGTTTTGPQTSGGPSQTPAGEIGDIEVSIDLCEDGCDGVVPDLGEVGEAGTIDETMTGYWDRMMAVPIVAVTFGLGTSMPTGVCPTESTYLDYLGTEITLDAHCALWEEVSWVLTAVMLAIWVFMGARIVMSA